MKLNTIDSNILPIFGATELPKTSASATHPRLLQIAWLSVVLLLLGVAIACGSDNVVFGSRGRTLEMQVMPPVIPEKVAFLDNEGRHRIIRPSATNRQLVAVEVTIVNRTSTVIPLLVDPDATQLGDRRGERIDALDPFEVARVSAEADPDEGKFHPLLWDEVELPRGTQVKGWVIYDVPKGLTLGSVWWNEVDVLVVDYINYFNR